MILYSILGAAALTIALPSPAMPKPQIFPQISNDGRTVQNQAVGTGDATETSEKKSDSRRDRLERFQAIKTRPAPTKRPDLSDDDDEYNRIRVEEIHRSR